jgi:hypothetical protein
MDRSLPAGSYSRDGKIIDITGTVVAGDTGSTDFNRKEQQLRSQR